MVRDNPERNRFELDVGGHTAFSEYKRSASSPGIVTFTHTEVPDALSGKGVGSALAKGALELVRARGEKIVVKCPFIKSYMEKHPEFNDLLAS
jgi:predicted GNAT family acetyltransferase